MPVWYVVGVLEFNPVEGCAVWKLLGVHETNTAEVRSGSLYQLVWRYHEQGMYQVQGFMVAREVSNPFRDFQIGV